MDLSRPLLLSPLFLLLGLGCSTTDDPVDEPDAEPVSLPEGESTYEGTMTLLGNEFALDLLLDNDGGDLVGELSFDGAGMTGTQELTGTLNPVGGRVALAPGEWIQAPAMAIELIGFEGDFDPETGVLDGVVVDYATPQSNELSGGVATLTLTSDPGTYTAIGDGSRGLAPGEHAFVGTSYCMAAPRDAELSVSVAADGALDGVVTLGGTDPLGSFYVTGVHNPTTGGFTLIPGLWEDGQTHNTLTFFVDGDVDGTSGEMVGDVRVNVGGCASATWQLSAD